jgi:hypothetical protein
MKLDMARYPSTCPACRRPALVLFQAVECSDVSCRHYKPHWLVEADPLDLLDVDWHTVWPP